MTFPPELNDYTSPDGSVIVPARVAERTLRLLTLGVRAARANNVPVDTDMVVVLDALQQAAVEWSERQSSASGTTNGRSIRLVNEDERMSVSTASRVAGRSTRAITKAIASGRLRAEKVGRDWQILATDLDLYRYGDARDRHSA